MRHFHLAATAALCSVVSASYAQAPALDKKDALPVTLLTGKSYSATEADVSRLSTPVPGAAYTLEVKGRYVSGTGRGLDVMANDATGMGFRVSMDATTLNWTNPVSSSSTISSTDNTKARTLRFAVSDGKVNIYEDGYYLATRPVESIQESIKTNYGDDVNPEVVPSAWSGTKPTPASKGWYIVNDGAEVTSWPNARYENDNSKFAMTNPDGSAYKGSFFFIRWDSNGYKTYKYAYAVTLEANTTYEFSMDAAFWDNNGATNITTEVFDNKLLTGSAIGSHAFSTSNSSGKRKFYPGSFQFTTTTAGTYYIAFSSAWSMFAIKNLQLHKVTNEVTPVILIGKDYEGEASLEVESATFDASGAYAPATLTGEPSTINYSDAGDVNRGFFFNTTANVAGKTNLHLTAEQNPFENSTISLQGDDAWLYFDYVKPSRVINDWLKYVKIDGATAEDGKNCRVTMWDNGTVVIPNGQAYDSRALVAYKGENFTGESREFEINTYHNNLGEWDNSIRSFKLKKGYMATLANNANGTGYSRVFIAADEDLEVPVMPEGMEKFVSFVRVFRWNWTSKKGKANGYGQKDQLNITCNYDWNVGGKSDDPDLEYSPIRQNLGWPSWNDINSKPGVTHLLGCNEPDRPDQANATVDQVIEMWPEMLKSGLRLGSPAPSSVWVWNGDFFNLIEQLGYRCDFAVAHIYEENKNGASLCDRIKTLSDKGKGRPVWITEWNNGANWTNEYWPTAKGPKCDANSNIIYNEDGSTTEVTRPLSKENAEKQRKFMAEALPALDKCDLLERYFEYDWVQDCRALVIGGELTPAGKVYGEHKAALAYNSKMERPWEAWKICPPFPLMDIDKDYRNITVRWYDHNGETGKKYILERRIDDETDFTPCREFLLGTDYQAGETVTFTEAIPCNSKVEYRIKALSYKDTESAYSRVKTFTRDAAAAAPVLKGEAVSTKIVKLSWEKVDGAKAYRIERSENKDNGFEVVADNLTETTWQDENLKPNTSYFYRAYSLNSAAERPASDVVEVKTKAYTVPEAMQDVRISAGSASASIRWAFAYDTFYRVSRSVDGGKNFSVVADKVDDTKFVDEHLDNGTTYYYKVQPWNEAGSGDETAVLEATPEAGKYMHLAFDENEGNMTYDLWGPSDGTLLNGAAFTEGRNGGYAVKLSKNSKSYVDLGSGAVSRLGDFTIATWIKLPGGKGRVFDFGSGTGIFMIAAAGSSNMKYKITCAKGAFDFTVPMAWSTTDWNHVVITQHGAEMKIYLNGELAGEGNNEKLIFPKDMGETTQNWLGRSQWAQDAYCDHVYDDFRIYDRAISDDDVKTLFADGELDLDDTETGISEIGSNDSAVKGIYNLNGMKVQKASKGIYIVDGKKQLVK